MKKKHTELLNYLLKRSTPVTSKELASILSISTRSIKNYVSEINLLSAIPIIHATKHGYSVQKKEAQALLRIKNETVPQTSEERMFFIIKKIMLEHTSHLDIYELCDSLFVVYSTIKADIAKMNKAFANFHVEFLCENDAIRLRGSEKDKRKLVSYVMYEETDKQFMDAVIIKNSFTNFSIEHVATIIRTTFTQYHYYINDFSFVNLLLHFAIIIDRIKEGNFVDNEDKEFCIESEIEQKLVYDLCDKLEQAFHIQFNENEQFEVYMLFKTNANYSMPSTEENLRKLVGEDIIKFVKDIVKKVNDDFYIDLNHESFMTPFSLHLKNLIIRAKNKTYTKNPMIEAIKNTCPTVYDIAIYIALKLMRRFPISIHEDEVAFLALHIGAEIERQKTNASKIRCVLLCPEYMNMKSTIYNRLLNDFGNQIHIIKTISYEYELEGLHYDMLISNIKIQGTLEKEVCIIPPFHTNTNLSHLQNCIDSLRVNQKNYILKKNFHNFFSKQLFLADHDVSERDAMIHLLCSKMLDMEYVHRDFEKKVMIRESAASTAFINIAIPHAMEMEAFKTCIGVGISSKGIRWDHHVVHIVLLVAINKVDKKIFHDLYEALVVLFSDSSIIEQAKECKDFSEFERFLYSRISYQDDIQNG